MGLGKLSAHDYRQQLEALLPRGPAWNVEPGSDRAALLDALSEEPARVDARAWDLLEEADPRTTRELLSDWERDSGLPDKCSFGIATTLTERRDALVAKLTQDGGASEAFFIVLAKQLGYEITITTYRPFIAGISSCGESLNGTHDMKPSPHVVRHVWHVTVHGARYTPFRTGMSQCGDLLGKITRAEDLICRLMTLKQAHTNLIVGYEGV